MKREIAVDDIPSRRPAAAVTANNDDRAEKRRFSVCLFCFRNCAVATRVHRTNARCGGDVLFRFRDHRFTFTSVRWICLFVFLFFRSPSRLVLSILFSFCFFFFFLDVSSKTTYVTTSVGRQKRTRRCRDHGGVERFEFLFFFTRDISLNSKRV